jgi:hypothetical protein
VLITQVPGLAAGLVQYVPGVTEYEALLIEQLLRIVPQTAEFTAALA